MTTAQESHTKTEQLSPAQWLIATVTVFRMHKHKLQFRKE